MKKFIKYLLFSLIFIISFVILYFVFEYSLSRYSTPYSLKNGEYEMFVKSNGVHTDIILPLKSDIINWFDFFSSSDTLSKRDDFSYISIGWGDKGFYLDTPTWADLKVKTAVVAALGLGSTALHITYYENIIEDDLTYKIYISKEQYEKIVLNIKESLQYKDEKVINIKTNAQYGQNDAFYEAIGSYSVFHTCNTWTNSVLKSAYLPASVWTAFDEGILYQYKNLKSNY